MKKFQLVCFALVLAISAIMSPSNLRAQVFPEGSNSVSIGYGFVTLLGALNSTFSEYSDVKTSGLGPIYFKYERALSDNIGLGLNVAYAVNEWSYRFPSVDTAGNPVLYTETTRRSTYSVLARFNYHIGSSDKFDPYIGMGLGYRNATWTFDTDNPGGGSGVNISNLFPLGFEMTFGARYFFTDNIGAYLEVGAAKSVLQAGLSVKF
ncbi:MAG: hypothetical protein M3R08_06125 [Bacteroidota bacterium]|nr:hypothetical protein [Bacteroidota bacterium]